MKIVYRHRLNGHKKIEEKDIINILLKNRQIKDEKTFLHPPHPASLSLSNLGFKGELKKTFAILESIKNNNTPVVIYTDYDADGITGGAILWETLHILGFQSMPYVPDRKKEGYGFSEIGIDVIKKRYNPALIISVDHGITAKEKVSYAKKLGIPIIITDHHLKPEKLPTDAFAIFHVPALSGSGVAYFFAKAIFEHFQTSLTSEVRNRLVHQFKHEYPALAAIGTIADLVPLVGPSRSIVAHGLEAACNTKRHGLVHIMKQAGIFGKRITPYEVGFIIAPRINAVGRLTHGLDALRLLCTTDDGRAALLAQSVGRTNAQRQDLVKEAIKEAREKVKRETSNAKHTPKIIILVSDKWHEGIIGLIASKICDEFYRPTIVMTKSDGYLKGSARSIGSFHITDFLRSLKKYLVDVGGHAGAAGFTIKQPQLKEFIKAAQKKAETMIKNGQLERSLQVDFEMPLSYASMSLVRGMEKLKPFGIGNPTPVFYSKAQLLDARLFGKRGEHLKLYVKDPAKNSFPLELISFGNAEIFQRLSTGMQLDIAYTLEIDCWGGTEKLRGRIIHII